MLYYVLDIPIQYYLTTHQASVGVEKQHIMFKHVVYVELRNLVVSHAEYPLPSQQINISYILFFLEAHTLSNINFETRCLRSQGGVYWEHKQCDVVYSQLQ